MSMVFLDAFVVPSGRPRGRLAGGLLALPSLRTLEALFGLTSIHGCYQSSSGWSITAVIIGSSRLAKNQFERLASRSFESFPWFPLFVPHLGLEELHASGGAGRPRPSQSLFTP